MSNVFNHFGAQVRVALQAIHPDLAADTVARVGVESPRDPSHGDLATNAAMVVAKPLGRKPRDVAEELSEKLRELDGVATVQVAGPGFINMRLDDAWWTGHLREVLHAGQRYGAEGLKPRKVNVEYVSANPTGPMHVGHCRGAVVGDALANLLAFAGEEVTREYYVNDAGGQIGVLANSVLYRVREALGEDVGPVPEGLYPGAYLVPVAERLASEHGAALLDADDRDQTVRRAAIDAMMALIKDDLALLGVQHDVFFSEATLHEFRGNTNAIGEIVAELQSRDLVYHGTLPPPKGKVDEDWEDREQLLLRSSEVGDDIDRPLAKSNGDYTYFAADVAYFADKYARGFEEMIFVLGADHAGYVKRLQAVAKAVAGEKAHLIVRLVQLVKLLRDGEPIAMGKRSGNFITLREVVEEVGRDAVRFMMLYRKNDAPLDFDFAKVTEQSRDNPVFYVQYAHSRTASAFRRAADEMPDLDASDAAIAKADLAKLSDEGELAIIRKLAEWPRAVEQAARTHEPHRIAFYLYELATAFNGHWSAGNQRPEIRFVKIDDPQMTLARLALTRAVANVLKAGLGIVGASAPDEMR